MISKESVNEKKSRDVKAKRHVISYLDESCGIYKDVESVISTLSDSNVKATPFDIVKAMFELIDNKSNIVEKIKENLMTDEEKLNERLKAFNSANSSDYTFNDIAKMLLNDEKLFNKAVGNKKNLSNKSSKKQLIPKVKKQEEPKLDASSLLN